MVVVTLFVTVVYNFFMYFIYTRKIPFFEQFRANKVMILKSRTRPGPGRQTPSNGTNFCGGQFGYALCDVGKCTKYVYCCPISLSRRFHARLQV